MTPFALNPALDAAALAIAFSAHGRLQIVDFLTPDAATALLAELVGSEGWRLAVNRGDRIVDFSDQALADFSPEQHDKLDRAVALGGRYGFQFRYDTIRLSDDGGQSATLLDQFRLFLCSPALVAFMRTLTGAADIDFADAHASRYRAGHFLTGHDDEVDEMGRRAAYVLNLSAEWRPDWGGLLLFHDPQGNIVRGYTPRFNSLCIFAVPQRHSVSWVNPLAGQPRYAVTGWLRASSPATGTSAPASLREPQAS